MTARPDHSLAAKADLGWNDVLMCSRIAWPQDMSVRNAIEPALAAAGCTLPGHCIGSKSPTLNLTLLNYTNIVGVASNRATLRFGQSSALRRLPIELKGFGSVSVYWHAENANCATVAMALESLRTFADPHMK